MEDFNTELAKHKRYIQLLAYKYGQGDSDIIKDLIQEGEIGFYEAYKRFKPELGNKLITYAKPWIIKYQLEYLGNHGRTIRIPFNVLAKIKRGEQASTNTISLELSNNTLDFGSNMTLHDVIPADEPDTSIDTKALYNALNEVKLKDKYRDILAMYFGLPPYLDSSTYEAIGTKWGSSKENIRQILSRILARIRKHESIKHLKQLL